MTVHSPPTTRALPVRASLPDRPLGLLETLRVARRNLLEIIPEAALTQPIVSGRTGVRWHMLQDPAAIRRVLIEAVDAYPKSDVTKTVLRPAVGESLFIAEGAHWRWQRRAAAPAFSHRNVAGLGPVMSRAAEASCGRIARSQGRAVDVFSEMVATTFDVIADVTFSGDDAFDKVQVQQAIDRYIVKAGRMTLADMFALPDWVPRPSRKAAMVDLDRVKGAALATVEAREDQRAGPSDLLDLLLDAEDPKTKRAMTRTELRDNLLTFIVAGHETTALTLSWALYLCAFDPKVQEAAREEAQSVLGSRAAEASDLAALPLVRRIVDEALRLYPPAGILSRTALEPDRLAGTQIEIGDTVTIPVYALHRHRAHWRDPDAFDPSRWEHGKPERFAYLPFGDGPRICIGASFALQEAVIILATLLSRFRFAPVTGRHPKPVQIITMRPEGGVWLNVQEAG